MNDAFIENNLNESVLILDSNETNASNTSEHSSNKRCNYCSSKNHQNKKHNSCPFNRKINQLDTNDLSHNNSLSINATVDIFDSSFNENYGVIIYNPLNANNQSTIIDDSINENSITNQKKCKSCGSSTHLNKKNNLCPHNSKNLQVK